MLGNGELDHEQRQITATHTTLPRCHGTVVHSSSDPLAFIADDSRATIVQCLAHAIFGAATFRLLKSPGVHLLAQPPKVLHRAAFRLIRYNCPLAQRPGRADPAPVRTLNRHPPVFSDEEFGLRTREIGHTGASATTSPSSMRSCASGRTTTIAIGHTALWADAVRTSTGKTRATVSPRS